MLPFGDDECEVFLARIRSVKPTNMAEWGDVFSFMRQWECRRYNIKRGRSDHGFLAQWYAIVRVLDEVIVDYLKGTPGRLAVEEMQ